MLALAYAAEQRQEVKVHRPDLCYPAQGFRMLHWSLTQFETLVGARGPITGVRMLTKRDDRIEAVVYLLRTGENYGQRMWDGRVEILREGLQGRIADGLLVRASMLLEREGDAQRAFGELEGFLVELAQASAPQARSQMVR
jgi:EpsI family protein